MKKNLLFGFLSLLFSLPFTQLSAQYISSTTVQATNYAVYPGQLAQSILRIEIEIGASPVTLSSMTFNTNGSTNPANDLLNAELWQYNDSAILNTTFGVLIGTVNGPLAGNNLTFLIPPNTYSGMTVAKKNYFWLAFDIAPGAIVCNYIDAEFTAFTADGISLVPAITSPVGARMVGICPTGVSENFKIPFVTISPNPSRDFVNVNFNTAIHDAVTIELVDITGKIVETLFNGIPEKNAFNFSLSNFESGVYLIRTIHSGRIDLSKFVIL